MFRSQSARPKVTGALIPYDGDISVGFPHCLGWRAGRITFDQDVHVLADVSAIAFQGDAALHFYELSDAHAFDLIRDIVGILSCRDRVLPLRVFEDIG